MADPTQPVVVNFNPNPSPKARFLSVKPYVNTHRDLVLRDDFQRALDYALMEYQTQVARNTDYAMAGAGHFRIVGALEFVTVLKTLSEQGVPQPARKPADLDHRV